MTATFTNDPAGRQIDAVRMLVGDTDCIPETDAALSDESIQWMLNNTNHLFLAAALAAETLAGQNAGTGSRNISEKRVGDLAIRYGGGGAVSDYKALAKLYRLQAARKATPYAGGISEADKDAQDADTDRVRPAAEIGMHDHRGSPGSENQRGVIEW